MAQENDTPVGVDEFVAPAELKIDLRNPRSPDSTFETEDDVIDYLVDHADVDELIQSILGSGWLDYEPLIVLADENVVLEGNRRLAALRILATPELRERLRITLDEPPNPRALPERIRIRRVRSRREARDFIGFKHINGPFKWDALAKAKYAAEWYEDGGDIKQISRRLGDRHNTVVRLVNGWNVLNQSLRQGFEFEQTTRQSFSFSHLYTGITRPNIRRYLGLPTDDVSGVLPENPVPEGHLNQLSRFMSWLYGQRNGPSVIRSQNPDLNKLVEVLGHETARLMLEANRDLDVAYGQVEDKGLQFNKALMNTIKQAEDAARLVGNYDGRAVLMSAGDNLRRTVLALHRSMKDTKDRFDLFCMLTSAIRDDRISSATVVALKQSMANHFQAVATDAAAGVLNGEAISFGFPRPEGTGFRHALANTVRRLQLGTPLDSVPLHSNGREKDAGIDVIAWRDFRDGRPSKLLLLGQVASGNDWREKSVQLYRFFDWFSKRPTEHYIPSIFIPFPLHHHCERRDDASFEDVAIANARHFEVGFGLVLDRLRIVESAAGRLAMAHGENSAVSTLAALNGWMENALTAARDAA